MRASGIPLSRPIVICFGTSNPKLCGYWHQTSVTAPVSVDAIKSPFFDLLFNGMPFFSSLLADVPQRGSHPLRSNNFNDNHGCRSKTDETTKAVIGQVGVVERSGLRIFLSSLCFPLGAWRSPLGALHYFPPRSHPNRDRGTLPPHPPPPPQQIEEKG